MLREVLLFTQHPVYEEDKNKDFKYRLIVLGKLILWSLLFSFAFLLVLGVFDLDLGEHANKEFLENYSTSSIVFIIAIAAPIIEELIFRGPIYWFRSKAGLQVALYLSIILFGLIHLSNFEDFITYWWVAPLLVAPQLSLGMFAGFIRVRFGILWSMALHSGYNLALTIPLILKDIFNISFE